MPQKEPEKSADNLDLDALLDGVNIEKVLLYWQPCPSSKVCCLPCADALNDFEPDQEPDTSDRPPSR